MVLNTYLHFFFAKEGEKLFVVSLADSHIRHEEFVTFSEKNLKKR
jgi:hypothetical protein